MICCFTCLYNPYLLSVNYGQQPEPRNIADFVVDDDFLDINDDSLVREIPDLLIDEEIYE